MERGEQAHRELDHQHGVRYDKRTPREATEPVSLTTVVLLDLVGEVLADMMFADRQSAVVGLVIVGAIKLDIPGFQPRKQPI